MLSATLADGQVLSPLAVPVRIEILSDLYVSPQTEHIGAGVVGSIMQEEMVLLSRRGYAFAVESVSALPPGVEVVSPGGVKPAGGRRFIVSLPVEAAGDYVAEVSFGVRYLDGPWQSERREVRRRVRFMGVSPVTSGPPG